jgi:hypothetical protein
MEGYMNIAELERVFGPFTRETVATTGGTAHRATLVVTALVHRAELAEQRLAELKFMLDEMRAQRDDVVQDRDRWRAQAERLALRAPEPEKQTWWRWPRRLAALLSG